MALGTQRHRPAATGPVSDVPRTAEAPIGDEFARRALGAGAPAELVVTDYPPPAPLQTITDAAGRAVATIQAPQDRMLLVDRITATVAAKVYVGDEAEANFVGNTSSTLATLPFPLLVPAGGVLRIVWAGAGNTQPVTANVQHRRGVVAP